VCDRNFFYFKQNGLA
jgi:hypothetical protein